MNYYSQFLSRARGQIATNPLTIIYRIRNLSNQDLHINETSKQRTRLGPIVFWSFCPLLRGCPLLEVIGTLNLVLCLEVISIAFIRGSTGQLFWSHIIRIV